MSLNISEGNEVSGTHAEQHFAPVDRLGSVRRRANLLATK